jgi:hypothetical protein
VDDQTLLGRETGIDLQTAAMNSKSKVGSRETKQINLPAADGIRSHLKIWQDV